MSQSQRRFDRRPLYVLAVAIAGVGAWLGCNGILGISDPVFVPYPEGGVDQPDGFVAPVDGQVTIGPVSSTRKGLRIPRGERSSFFIAVDPTAIKPGSGNIVLTARPLITQDLSVFQVADGANRFKVTLTAKPDAKNVDEKLLMQAVSEKNEIIGAVEIRVLVGTTGTPDPSFGVAGVASTIGAPQGVQFALVGGAGLLFVAEDNSVNELDEDGLEAHRMFDLDTKGKAECGISAITADQGTVLVSGYCPSTTEDFLAQGPRVRDGGRQPIEIVAQQDLFRIARFADAGWYLGLANPQGIEVKAWPKAPPGLLAGASIVVPITQPAALVPGDGGLMVVGREVDPDHIPEIARLAGTPLDLVPTYGDAGIASGETPLTDPATDELGTGLPSTTGTVLLATPVADKIVIQAFTHKGLPAAAPSTTIDGFTSVAMAADRKDRFIVAAGKADGTVIVRRFNGDGTADDTLGTAVGAKACPKMQVGVDEDGMIVVFCANSPKSTAYRFWP